MFRPGCWLVFAAIIALPSTGFAQVQVNQNFVTQGPAPSFGPTDTVQSGDAPPNGNVAGAVGPIVADPVDPNTFYVGSPAGGVWKTTNGGTTWTPLTDNQSSLSIASLSQDPTNRNALIAGTGLTANGTVCPSTACFFTGSGGLRNGVLYSPNGGSTWTELGAATLAGQTVDAVAARGNILIAGTFETSFAASAAQQRVGGLYRSVDGGANFTQVSGTGGLPLGPVTSIIGDPNNTNRLYAAVTTPSAVQNANTAVFVSNDAGANWTQVFGAGQSNGTIQAGSQTVLKVATGPGGVIAVGVVDMTTRTVTGLFWSNNSGTSWTTLTVPVLNNGGQAPVNFAIGVDPNNPNLVFVAGDRIAAPPLHCDRISDRRPQRPRNRDKHHQCKHLKRLDGSCRLARYRLRRQRPVAPFIRWHDLCSNQCPERYWRLDAGERQPIALRIRASGVRRRGQTSDGRRTGQRRHNPGGTKFFELERDAWRGWHQRPRQ
jgi:hypothetical protein